MECFWKESGNVNLEQYAVLKSMLHAMEKDLGLTDLSSAEKAILSAVAPLQDALNEVSLSRRAV